MNNTQFLDCYIKTKTLNPHVGSNQGGYYTTKNSKKEQVYVKIYANPIQAMCEHLANMFYLGVGLYAPQSRLETYGAKLYYISPIIHGTMLNDVDLESDKGKKICKTICNDIIFDIFIGNWDVIGLGYDNILIKDNTHQHVYRIDNGAAFLLRAQGTPKGKCPIIDTSTNMLMQITEWDNFIDSEINEQYANLLSIAGYANICNTNVKNAIEKITALKELYKGWDKFIEQHIEQYIPIDSASKGCLIKMMTERQTLLEKKIASCKQAQSQTEAGGSRIVNKSIFILNRNRKIIPYVKYNNELITLTKAMNLDKKRKSK